MDSENTAQQDIAEKEKGFETVGKRTNSFESGVRDNIDNSAEQPANRTFWMTESPAINTYSPQRNIAPQKPESKITRTTAVLMVLVSLFFDIVEVILDFFVVGYIINKIIDWLIALPIFYFWFKIKGVSFLGGENTTRKVLSLFSDVIIDWIPFLDSFGWTIDVVLVITAVWAEEKIAHSRVLASAANFAAAANARSLQQTIASQNMIRAQQNQPTQ